MGVGAGHCPLGLHALWGLRAAGLVGGGPWGGCPATVVRRSSLWGWRKGVPGGGAFHHCEGRLGSGAVPPPTARPLGGLLGSATHVLWMRVCGCGGPTLSPWPACAVGAACRGVGGGPSPGGGWPATVVRGVWCQVLSLLRTPVLWSVQPGFRDPCVPAAVGAGVGTLHRPQGARPCGPALRAGAGGGRASPGGLPSAVVRGVWGQTILLPRLPALWAGCRGSLTTCCGCGCGCVPCVWCLCGACGGARCRFSLVPLVLPSPVLRCGVVLAVCLPSPPPCARPLLGCWLPPVSFVASLLFIFPLPFYLACTFSLPPLWCVFRSFSLLACCSLSLGLPL